MTQTPSRDWQNDMDRVQSMIKMGAFEEWTEPMLYWLQKYESKKSTARVYREQSLKQMREKREIRAREQRLKEELEGALRFINRTEHIPEETVAGYVRAHFIQALSTLYPDTPAQPPAPTPEITARSIDDWHEDYGDVLWWTFPIQEPPYCGSPLDSNWPDYHTHWTPLVIPAAPAPKEGE
ncbi:hypothetical protein [Paenibacillus graminis]|uniref:hypothetical protein n=1 Tax=Paenibacillus graminis TaxID=189425 RepID=UPI002DB941C2|nr:hypothetical protein [Paenibacillus graminis]MEC0169745.1 hypothetical protein [Paenibacillus graminis]